MKLKYGQRSTTELKYEFQLCICCFLLVPFLLWRGWTSAVKTGQERITQNQATYDSSPTWANFDSVQTERSGH